MLSAAMPRCWKIGRDLRDFRSLGLVNDTETSLSVGMYCVFLQCVVLSLSFSNTDEGNLHGPGVEHQ